jgi:hypothetical protein
MEQAIAQGIGFIGFLILGLSFQSNTRSTIISLRSLSNLLAAVHYYYLGAPTAAILFLVSIGRNVIFQFRTDVAFFNHTSWLWSFLGLYIIIGILSWTGIVSLLSVLGLGFGTIAIWNMSTTRIRVFSVLSTLAWLFHNIIILSYAGIISSTLFLVSLTIALLRYDTEKMKRYLHNALWK